jgi:xylan 1,4-beta-xylosidase
MARLFALALIAVATSILQTVSGQGTNSVAIQVDAANVVGPMTPIWAWYGYDEPNYTYTENGKRLLSELSDLSPVPVHVRAHNLLTSGDGTAALKWGSTNAYTEDANGRAIYDWTIVDRIFDTYVERKMKPLVEIGFMPEALSTDPQPYRHDWMPGMDYGRIYTVWTYPPKDYAKWGELVRQWVLHSVERYGRTEVAAGTGKSGTSPTSATGAARPKSSASCTTMRPTD